MKRIITLAFILCLLLATTQAAKGGGKKNRRIGQPPTAYQTDNNKQQIKDTKTIVKTLSRTLNPALNKSPNAPAVPATPATPNAPANPNQPKVIQCVHSTAIPLPKYQDNAVLKQHIDLMIDVSRVDDGKFLALNEFEEFKEQVWEFMAKKKLDALEKSAEMIAPNYIVNIGVYHAFKLAEEHMGRFHTNLVTHFATEYGDLTKNAKTKKQRAAVGAKLKERLQEYEFRVAELDCLFQKGLAFLVPSKKAQAGNVSKNKTNGTVQMQVQGNSIPFNGKGKGKGKGNRQKTAPAIQVGRQRRRT